MIISIHGGETSYRNHDFTPATEIVKWKRELMINDHNPKVKLSMIPSEPLMSLSIRSGEDSYHNLNLTPAMDEYNS